MDVRIEGLRFSRDRRGILDIPSLCIHGDRTTAILGPNGAGKTTLLRLIAGLESPDEGRVVVGGMPVRRGRRTHQNAAFVFQEHVFLRRSVRQNLELGLVLRRVPQQEANARIEEAARLLGISHLLDRRADTLSGGEGRRASLARAVCLRAALVLLDEPLAGLDPPTYARLLDELPQLLDAFGATAILVTHDRDEALRLGQDLIVLIGGRVQSAGAKRDVLLRPTGVEAAEILGYTVLHTGGRRVAVRKRELELGPGSVEFWMVVEEVLDLVDHREVVGRIGESLVHIVPPVTAQVPARGARVLVHADRAWEIA